MSKSKVIALNNFIQYCLWQIVQLFWLTFLLIKALTSHHNNNYKISFALALGFQTMAHRV